MNDSNYEDSENQLEQDRGMDIDASDLWLKKKKKQRKN